MWYYISIDCFPSSHLIRICYFTPRNLWWLKSIKYVLFNMHLRKSYYKPRSFLRSWSSPPRSRPGANNTPSRDTIPWIIHLGIFWRWKGKFTLTWVGQLAGGWSTRAVTPALWWFRVFSTCQEPILTTLMELSSLAVSRWAVGPWKTVPSILKKENNYRKH